MRSRFPHGGDVLGAAPANPLLAPYPLLDRGLSMSRQRDLLDLQAIQRIPGLVGYWKSDPAYLYEDSAGTTPASTSGTGPVGHWKPVGIQTTLGPELVTDPGFDNSAAWATKTNFVVANSVLTIDDATPYQSFAQLATVLLGLNWYEIVIVIDSITSGSFKTQHSNGNTTTYSSILMNAAGTYRFYHYTQNNTTIGIRTDNLGFVGVISSISMRLVSGIPAAQPTTANKPILRKTPTTGVYWADSNTATSALNVALGNLGSACTVARSGAEGVTFTENVSITSTYNIAPAFSFNSDVAIFNRALTATEKALITRYMARAVPLLGSNVVTNGTFDTDTAWTKGTGWSIGSGVASKSAGTASNLTQSVGVSGAVYYAKADAVVTAGTIGAYPGSGTTQFGSTSATGTLAHAMKASGTGIGVRGDASFAGSVDNAAIKEIL